MKTRRAHRNLSLHLTVASTALVLVFIVFALGGYYFWRVDRDENLLDQEILSETAELLGLHEQAGGQRLAQAIRQRIELEERAGTPLGDHFYLFIESDTKISVGNVADWPTEAEAGSDPQTLMLNPSAETGPLPVLQHKARVRVELLDNGGRLLVGQNLAARNDSRQNLLWGLVIGGMAALMLAMTTGILMSRSLLARVGQMNHTILRIMGGDRSERMPYRKDGDEFDELAHHFAEMLDDNEHLVSAMRSVTNDIAHDLRTPLSRLLNRVEIALASPGSEAHLRETLEDVRKDTSGVLATFQELLSIALIESHTLREQMQAVSMDAVVSDAVEFYQPVAEDRGQTIQVETEVCDVQGNQHLLAQLCTNLLDNAVKYTAQGGQIQVHLTISDKGARLTVSDNGPGIPESDREHVLERFVRLDDSRSKPGTGLGLSFVKAVAELHGASLRLEDADPGLRVVLNFPAISSAEEFPPSSAS